MEGAVSLTGTIDIRPSATADVESFTAGEKFAVHPDAIERELASVWQAAGKASEGRQPVTRACLWNVVVLVDNRDGQAEEGMETMLADLPRYVATRTLICRAGPAATASSGKGGDIRSWISANCILASGGGKLVCSEEINLESSGDGAKHIPSLVRALLVPGLPTAVVLGTAPRGDDGLASALINVADRVVVQRASAGPDSFRWMLDGLGGGRSLTDLRWIEQAAMRSSVALLFDGLPDGTADRLELIEVLVHASQRGDGLLALGWVASCLGAQEVTERAPDEWKLRTSAGLLTLGLTGHAHAGGRELRFSGPGMNMRVERRGTGEIFVRSDLGESKSAGQQPNLAATLARALLAPPRDPVFMEALHWAQEISG